jgi:hypothetical protein
MVVLGFGGGGRGEEKGKNTRGLKRGESPNIHPTIYYHTIPLYYHIISHIIQGVQLKSGPILI